MRKQGWGVEAEMLDVNDHVGCWRDGRRALYGLAARVFSTGARLGDKMVFIAENPDPDDLEGLADLDRLVSRGDLELHRVDDIYGATHDFDPQSQLSTFEEMLSAARKAGYRSLRIVADNTLLATGSEDEFSRWLVWEHLTDRFHSASMATGLCFFDSNLVNDPRRKMVLAALHPMWDGVPEPPFGLYWEGGVLWLTGEVDFFSAEAFRRVLSAAPGDHDLTVDLSHTAYADHRMLLALAATAAPGRPIHVRGARPILRTVADLLSSGTGKALDIENVRFE